MKLLAWQKKTAGISLFLSLLYTASFIYPIYWYPVRAGAATTCQAIYYITWILFFLDYIYQILISEDSLKYLKTHILEFLLVVLPFFRPLRALRALVFTFQAGSRSKKAFIQSMPLVVSIATVMMIVIMGAAVLDIERNVPGSHIQTPSDALWWGLVTITTIGYGDIFPITNEGRLVAGVLIIFGVAMISTLTGAFAAWLLDDKD